MARPKEFDREEALRRAIPVFWEKGFAGTSADDLVGAMGIGRQSLYDTFGDKRRLFLAALRTYNTDGVTALSRKLRAGPTALAAIGRILVDLAEVREKARSLGCMGVNAICEMAREDAEVRASPRPAPPCWRRPSRTRSKTARPRATSPPPSTAALPRASSQPR